MKKTENTENEGLLVRRIRNGTVIDHIDGGEALNVVKILGITGTTQEALSIATNVPAGIWDARISSNLPTGTLERGGRPDCTHLPPGHDQYYPEFQGLREERSRDSHAHCRACPVP